MENILNRVKALLIDLKEIPSVYKPERSEKIIDIYYSFEPIVKFLVDNNPRLWLSLSTGVSHIKFKHIETLENHKLSQKRKIDAYQLAHEQLRLDLQEVLDRLSTVDG